MTRPPRRRPLRLEHLEDRATPAVFTVTNLGDAGVGTGTSGDLRYSITAANDEVTFPGPDTIKFDSPVTRGRVDLLTADPLTLGTAAFIITSDVSITGTGETIARGSALPFRLFNVTNTGRLTLDSLTLTGGFSTVGGAISNDGDLRVANSTLIGNATKGERGRFVTGFTDPVEPGHGEGGAIYNTKTLVVVNSTIVGNTAAGGDQGVADAAGLGEGGGIFNDKGTAVLVNNTIARNVVINGVGPSPGNPRGGALYNFTNQAGVPAVANLANNIFSDTNDGIAGDGIFSDVAAEGGGGAGPATLVTNAPNIVSVNEELFGGTVSGLAFKLADPLLGPLQNNGGAFRTMLPKAGSPAIDAGDNTIVAKPVPIGAGLNEVQRLTVVGMTGTFTLTFTGPKNTTEKTTDLPITATAGDIEVALNALPSLTGTVKVTTSGSDFIITFSGALQTTDVKPLIAGVEGGATASVGTLVEGLRYVTDQRGAPFNRISNGKIDLGALEAQVPVVVLPMGTTTPPATPPIALTAGRVGLAYTNKLVASGPPGPYTFTQTTGTLPPGITLLSDGTLSGSPSLEGTYVFTVKATNATSPITESGSSDFSLLINPAPPVVPPPPPGSPPPPPPPPGGGPGGGPTRNPNSDDGGRGPGGRVLITAGRNDGTIQVFDFDAIAGLVRRGGPFAPFPGFAGVIRVAAADMNNDGTGDFILATGPGGGSQVRILSGKTGSDLTPSFSVFEPGFTGGLYVAAADLDNDGKAEVAFTPDRGGGGRVVVYSLTSSGIVTTPVVRANFFGIDDPSFRGGARVAMADVSGDGVPELVVGAGFGGGPRVAVFNGASLFSEVPGKLVNDFFAFPGTDAVTLRNGVFVTAGDYTGDGFADLAFGGGPGGGPRVLVLDGNLVRQGLVSAAQANPFANFFAFDAAERGGVRLATKEGDGDRFRELVVGSGDGQLPVVGVYRGNDLVVGLVRASVSNPFDDLSIDNGVYVG